MSAGSTKSKAPPGRLPGQAAVNHRQALAALQAQADPERAQLLAGFFKTGKGQYAEGDRFLGIMVPALRRLAGEFRQLPLQHCERLLHSPFNEARLLALVLLVAHFEQGDARAQDEIYWLYLKNRSRINNWNLVDASAPYIVGTHLLGRSRAELAALAQSRSLWDRRIAVVATLAFIREGDFADTLKLTAQLLDDDQDLMHKACGWMLREVGKRDQPVLEKFLRRHHPRMPRTMLRYAIERFPEQRRQAYLSGQFG